MALTRQTESSKCWFVFRHSGSCRQCLSKATSSSRRGASISAVSWDVLSTQRKTQCIILHKQMQKIFQRAASFCFMQSIFNADKCSDLSCMLDPTTYPPAPIHNTAGLHRSSSYQQLNCRAETSFLRGPTAVSDPSVWGCGLAVGCQGPQVKGCTGCVQLGVRPERQHLAPALHPAFPRKIASGVLTQVRFCSGSNMCEICFPELQL